MSPRTVLVVDDERDIEPLFRSRFRREIRQGVVEFDFAFSGEDALDRVRSDKDGIVLIFSDVSMPGMSGIGVTQANSVTTMRSSGLHDHRIRPEHRARSACLRRHWVPYEAFGHGCTARPPRS